MLKRTILALGLASMAGQAAATTMTIESASATTATQYSPEGMNTSTTVNSPYLEFTTEVTLAAANTFNLTFTEAPTNPSAATAAVPSGCGGSAAIVYSGTTNAGKTLNYSITASGSHSAGCKIKIGGTADLKFAKAAVTTAGIKASAGFTVVGSGVDPMAATLFLKQGTAQFGFTAAALDQVVNVETANKTFATGTTDVLTLTGANTGFGAGSATSKIVITGDFNWADNAAVAGYQLASGSIALTSGTNQSVGTGADAPTATTYTILDTSPAAAEAYVVTFTPQTSTLATALPVGTYSATQTITYNDIEGATATAVKTASAGAWTLNGAVVKVFAVPFGAEVVSHSIFISNKGTTTGAITASMLWNGNAAVALDLGNVQAGANKYINVNAALDALGEKPTFGRADITFTVNSPAADIAMTAGYNTAEGRANLFMTEQANLATISNAAKTSAATAATKATAAATDANAAHLQSDRVCANLTAGGNDDASRASSPSLTAFYNAAACL